MSDVVTERLYAIAKGASRRMREANEALDVAEREYREAWEAFDAHAKSQADTAAEPKRG
jgi:hypothetical protein